MLEGTKKEGRGTQDKKTSDVQYLGTLVLLSNPGPTASGV